MVTSERGKRFLNLLRLDYENLLKDARLQVSLLKRTQNLYVSEDDLDPEIASYIKDVSFFKRKLEEMGGIEDDTYKQSSIPQFVESCVSV